MVGVVAGRRQPAAMSANAMEPAVLLRTFDRELSLDSSQHERIARVLSNHQRVIDSAWAAVRPVVRSAIDSAQNEIVAILTADQNVKYHQLLRAAHPGMNQPGERQ
ncbi:MAG: hypothetical protein M3Y05_06015 [Gemmatimonadota bacterium]|nr:hypothetical protein [Gemmatimonadota bacterium]